MSRPIYKVSNTAQDEAVNFNRLATYSEESASGSETFALEAIKTAFASAHDSIILNSTTEGSTKKFVITVDDEGELTATEVTEGDDDNTDGGDEDTDGGDGDTDGGDAE